MFRGHLTAVLLALAASALADAAEPQLGTAEKQAVYLEQGWSAEERQRFYYTTQGSQLIPYDWFLALEQPGRGESFRSNENMERLRFIPQLPNTDRNPDGLPIGFVKDDNPDTVLDYSAKRSFLGSHFNRRSYTVLTNAWLGLTCAACHTAQIEYGSKAIRIDGGPAMADVERFLRELSAALNATHEHDDALDRFARVVLKDTGYNTGERDALRERLNAYSKVLNQLVRRSSVNHPYGFARLDAFGSILNEVCETSLEIPGNHYPADAPASYPFLWNTPQLDWVQWNGTADNPLAHNIGEVLGVFGQVNLQLDPPENQFKSTAHLQNLVWLEDQIDELEAPPWPADLLGELNDDAVREGKDMFAENCAKCHSIRVEATNDFPRTAPNALGKEFIKTHMIGLKDIGTDPALAMNFAARKANPGFLMPAGTPPVNRAEILKFAVRGVIKRKIADSRPAIDPETIQRINGFRVPGTAPPNPLAYKARPLNGIWATAPFLHNGSVPSLDALLRPAKDRPRQFWVGSRSFDPSLVGFATQQTEGALEFRVVDQAGQLIPGNSNQGHDGKYYTQLKTEDGTWRDFNDGERLALIEYMKTLR